jgi:hypothetical protein
MRFRFGPMMIWCSNHSSLCIDPLADFEATVLIPTNLWFVDLPSI